MFAVVLLDKQRARLFLSQLGFGIVIPILPFITPRLGGSTFDIALIIVAYGVAASLVGPFWGRLSDRIGRKPVLMICTGGAGLAYLMLAGASELWMVYLARTVAGLMAGNFPVASAMICTLSGRLLKAVRLLPMKRTFIPSPRSPIPVGVPGEGLHTITRGKTSGKSQRGQAE